jgi:hypothetical protein
MRIEELWQQLEEEARSQGGKGWLSRFALPTPAQPLLVALEISENLRALRLPVPSNAIPSRNEWPECSGLEIFSEVVSGQSFLGVKLRERRNADVFSGLAEDVAPRVAQATSSSEAVSVLLGRLRRWQRFLSAGSGGLSPQRQRGLFGELHTLRSHLFPNLGPNAALGWRAPHASHQDFQFASGAVEVKTTIAKQPQAIRITSERQLDDTGIPALFLHVVVLDEREVQGPSQGESQSLPELILVVREMLMGHGAVKEKFDDDLLDAGYLVSDISRYTDRRFTIRKEMTFKIRTGFPRILEKDLPLGVGDTNYAVSLAACQEYSVPISEIVRALRLTPGPVPLQNI